MSRFKKLPVPFRIILFSVLGILVAIVGSFVCFYIDRFMFPLEPKTSGVIPKEPEWVFHADDQVVSTPIVSDNKVFIRTCCSIEAVDANTGNLLWRAESNSPSRTNGKELVLQPLVYEDYLIVPEEGSIVAAYSTTTGQLLWVTPEPEIDVDARDIITIESYAIKDEKLFVARWSWMLSAYDLLTGKLLWEVPVLGKVSLNIEPGTKCVYVSEGKVLRCHDLDGNLLWEKEFDTFIGPILFKNETLYIAMYLGTAILTALDTESLEVKWMTNQDEISDKRLNRLVLAGDDLYAGGERLNAISTHDGSVIWSSKELGILEQPILFEGYVIARNKDKDLFLLESTNGDVIGHIKVKANPPFVQQPDRSPTIAGNLLIVPFGDNRVFAYRLK